MALTTVVIHTTDFSLVAAATPYRITLRSNDAAIYDPVAGKDVQRRITSTTDGSGTASIPMEENATLSDTTSDYTFEIGTSNRYSGVVVTHSASPVTLLSLLPTRTDNTVSCTLDSGDPSETPVPGEQVKAYLSVDCVHNISGKFIYGGLPVSDDLDTSGHGILHLDLTTDLTPVGGGAEPFYKIPIGQSTYYKHIHGGGNILSQPDAAPVSVTGSVGAMPNVMAAYGDTTYGGLNGAATRLPIGPAVGDVGTVTNSAPFLAAPAAPGPSHLGSGGTVLAGVYGVKTTYVNAQGETVASSAGTVTTTGSTSTITVPSPSAAGVDSQVATGWYAYVTQAGGATYKLQQTPGSPTAIGTGLTLTAPPNNTGAMPPGANTAGTRIPGWAAAAGGARTITVVNDTNATISDVDQTVLASALTANRTLTLPVITSLNREITVTAAVGAGHFVIVVPGGTDYLQGGSRHIFAGGESITFTVESAGTWRYAGNLGDLLTSPGDLLTIDGGSNGLARVSVSGTDGNVLTEDSGSSLGMSWQTPADPNSNAISTVTAAHPIVLTDGTILADCSSAGFTVTLPTAVGIAGKRFTVKKIGSGANTLTLATTSAQTVDGASPPTTTTNNTIYRLQSDGANWQTV